MSNLLYLLTTSLLYLTPSLLYQKTSLLYQTSCLLNQTPSLLYQTTCLLYQTPSLLYQTHFVRFTLCKSSEIPELAYLFLVGRYFLLSSMPEPSVRWLVGQKSAKGHLMERSVMHYYSEMQYWVEVQGCLAWLWNTQGHCKCFLVLFFNKWQSMGLSFRLISVPSPHFSCLSLQGYRRLSVDIEAMRDQRREVRDKWKMILENLGERQGGGVCGCGRVCVWGEKGEKRNGEG